MAFIESTTSTSMHVAIPIVPSGPVRVRFSRDAYHRLFEIGVLHGDRRFELLDGDVYMMSPIGPTPSNVTSRLTEFFVRCLSRDMQCRIQQPIVIGDFSEPEPDVAIVRRRDAEYSNQHPVPADVALLIEVSQTSLSIDLDLKAQLYSAAGIAEYWVVDLVNRQVVVHRDASPAGYRAINNVSPDSTIAPLAAPQCQLDLGWLFR